MKIFEVLGQSPQQQLQDINQEPENEEDDSNDKFSADQVDNNLKDTAANINDQNAMPEPEDGGQEDPEFDDQNVKPLDDALMSQIKSLPYATKYEFDDKSPLNPIRIAGMEIADLSNLANTVKVKMQNEMMKNPLGYDDDTIGYCNDLLRFINVVMKFKKTNTKIQLDKINPSSSYNNNSKQ